MEVLVVADSTLLIIGLLPLSLSSYRRISTKPSSVLCFTKSLIYIQHKNQPNENIMMYNIVVL